MNVETITFDKRDISGFARIGNGMDVRYVYRVKDNANGVANC